MENEKLALGLAQHKPSLRLVYIDDTLVVWPHGPELSQNFLSHLTSLRHSIEFTMETESDSVDVQVIRKETTMVTKVYRKPTHTGRYYDFKFNHPPHAKRGLFQSSQ
jgi:hypothetical protein